MCCMFVIHHDLSLIPWVFSDVPHLLVDFSIVSIALHGALHPELARRAEAARARARTRPARCPCSGSPRSLPADGRQVPWNGSVDGGHPYPIHDPSGTAMTDCRETADRGVVVLVGSVWGGSPIPVPWRIMECIWAMTYARGDLDMGLP